MDLVLNASAGETIAIPFEGDDGDGDLFGFILTSGLSDPSAGTLLSTCFCHRTLEGADVCACSSTFTASAEIAGTVTTTFTYRAVDATGLQSADATVTILVGEEPTVEQLIASLRATIERAVAGDGIHGGIATALQAKITALESLLQAGRTAGTLGVLAGLEEQVVSQLRLHIAEEVADRLLTIIGRIRLILEPPCDCDIEFSPAGSQADPLPRATGTYRFVRDTETIDQLTFRIPAPREPGIVVRAVAEGTGDAYRFQGGLWVQMRAGQGSRITGRVDYTNEAGQQLNVPFRYSIDPLLWFVAAGSTEVRQVPTCTTDEMRVSLRLSLWGAAQWERMLNDLFTSVPDLFATHAEHVVAQGQLPDWFNNEGVTAVSRVAVESVEIRGEPDARYFPWGQCGDHRPAPDPRVTREPTDPPIPRAISMTQEH